MKYEDIIRRLEELKDPAAVEGMARFGITPEKAYGVSMPALTKMAREIGTDHELAGRLWALNVRETRVLACLIDSPELVTEEQMEEWVHGFNYWELCDQCCIKLFRRTKFAYAKAIEWSSVDEEFVKRAGFVMMATMAVHEKKMPEERIMRFFSLIKDAAYDNRPLVKKAVNWALRQIGKRSMTLNKEAVKVAQEIEEMDSKDARWIASDALRELTSETVQNRLSRAK